MTAIALTIAGSEASGGAGAQTDLKTFHTLGVYGCTALTWTFLSPAPEFTDKPRTGTYAEGGDQPAGSEISVADFAVALVDEAEKDAHRGHRWTIANA